MISYWNEESIKKMNEELYGIWLLLNIMGFFGWKKWREMRKDNNRLKEEYQKYVQSIDDFSFFLWPLWWTLFWGISIRDSGYVVDEIKKWNIVDAEDILCKIISEKIPQYKIRFSKNLIEAFYIRKELLLLALKDHEEERYHASIPVLLSCIDGIVSDVTPEQKWAFSEGVHLIIPNSIVWYEGGLPQTISLFSSVRRKTNHESIEIPYRNWIIHGHDINYYNKITAHKTLALLFALFDWVKDKQEYEKTKKIKQTPATEGKTWKDIFRDLKKYNDEKKYQEEMLSAWERRNRDQLEVIIKERWYAENTPEKLIHDNFFALQQKKYWIVAEHLSSLLMRDLTVKKYAGILRNIMKNIEFLDFQIISIDDEAPAISQIEYMVNYNMKGIPKKSRIIQRLIYENEKWTPLVRGAIWWTRKTVFRIDDLLWIESDLKLDTLL